MDANNRAYYAIFHSMRAILALDGADFKKHSAVISFFRENYIKTGYLERSLSDIIGRAGIVRNKSDYEDFYIASKDEAEEQVNDSRLFVKDYIPTILRSTKSRCTTTTPPTYIFAPQTSTPKYTAQ